MKQIIILFTVLLLFSCGEKKEVKLAEATTTIVKEMEDYSTVYIFFQKKKNDTIANVNRDNTISSTNWIFHIDKRLPLRLVIPQVIKLQAKKENSLHKSEDSENFFSYSNTAKKELTFLPFTQIKFHVGKPKFGNTIYFGKTNEIWVNNTKVNTEELENYLSKLVENKPMSFNFCFDKNLSFDTYVNDKVMLLKSKYLNEPISKFSRITNEEYIY